MKRNLPAYWTTQLAAIIIVFSVGVALFPMGWLAYSHWPGTYYWEPDYTYRGVFEANLTAATPVASVVVGNCDTIEIADERWDAAEPVTLRVYNETYSLFAVIPSFGRGTLWHRASVDLHFATAQNYTVQVERETWDAFFRCYIRAYNYSLPPPVFPFLVFPYPYFVMGSFLILFGLVLTSNFVRRTRAFYWTA